MTRTPENQSAPTAPFEAVASSTGNALRWALRSLIALVAAGCASEASAPRCESPPGMPDRPCTADEAHQQFYRQDQPQAIGAAGKPQLVVFYLEARPDSGCPNCALFRPKVQALEVEYWGRIDFVYLNKDTDGLEPLLLEFRVPRMPMGGYSTGLDLIFVSPEREILRHFHLSAGRVGQDFPEQHLRYSFDSYLQEREQSQGGSP